MKFCLTILLYPSVGSCDKTALRTVSKRNQNRYYIEFDFVEVARKYLKTAPGSEERELFVKKRQELIEQIVVVGTDIRHMHLLWPPVLIRTFVLVCV